MNIKNSKNQYLHREVLVDDEGVIITPIWKNGVNGAVYYGSKEEAKFQIDLLNKFTNWKWGLIVEDEPVNIKSGWGTFN